MTETSFTEDSVLISSKEQDTVGSISDDINIHSGKTWDSKINFLASISTSGIINFFSKGESEEVVEESELSSEELSESELSGWDSDVSWPDFVLPDSWGTQALEQIPWADWTKPVVKFNDYNPHKFNEIEHGGILTDRIIASCSSYLDQCPKFKQFVLCKCTLANKCLTDISILSYHHYIQYLDLSCNYLRDLSALGQLPFLMYLDVSHNQLMDALKFKAPFNLTYVNLSHNFIRTLDDLPDFWSIVYLDLSHNEICVIDGLEQLMYLRHLDLSYNYITYLENLNHMRLQTLNIKHNYINKFEEGNDIGLKTLKELIRIQLDYNLLKTLTMFKEMQSLQDISMSSNLIADLKELNNLRGLRYLTQVNFKHNPISSMDDYFDVCLDCIKTLFVLDDVLITASEKVKAKSRFINSPRRASMRKEASLFLMEQLNHPLIGPPIVPVNQPPPPIIIIVGPPASRKELFVQKLCEKYEKYAKIGVSYTTRPKRESEIDGVTYHFINNLQFKNLAQDGEFLSVQEHIGHQYAFGHTELEKVINERSVLVTHCDLAAALTLKARGLKPTLVLAMPKSVDIHTYWLLEKYYCSTWNKHPGAVLIENWPENCKLLLEEAQKLSEVAVMNMAEEFLNKIIDTVTSCDVSETVVCENEKEEDSDEYDYKDDISDISSISHGGVKTTSDSFGGNYRMTSSILKDGHKTTRIFNGQHQREGRLSVTFQSSSDEESACSAPQTSRSVTFRCNSNEDVLIKEYSYPYSASATILGAEERSTVHLSALSGVEINDMTKELSYESASKKTMETKEIQEKLTFVKVFLEECIKLRNIYLQFHEFNPGLFSAVVYTDEVEETMDTLKKILKSCIEGHKNAVPAYTFKKDAVYDTIVTKRLTDMQNEINKHLCVGTKTSNGSSAKEQKS